MSSSCSTTRTGGRGTTSRSRQAGNCSNARSPSTAGGPYALQAAIADLHLREPRNWEEIALLYERLEQITGSPVVTMNRTIAVAEVGGPQAGLALLDRLELEEYRYYHSTRADLLRRLRRPDEAAAAYARAVELTQPGPERRFLETRLAQLEKGAEQHPDS